MNKFNNISDAELKAELKRRAEERAKHYLKVSSPVGTWKITTEGDCEGRTTQQLGTHSGELAEVLLGLGKSALYSLWVHPIEDMPAVPVKAPSANFYYGDLVNSGFDDRVEKAVQEFQKFFGPNYIVEPGQWYKSLVIKRKP